MVEIKKHNEVIRFVKKTNGSFYAVFGAVAEGRSNLYEMDLTQRELCDIVNFVLPNLKITPKNMSYRVEKELKNG